MYSSDICKVTVDSQVSTLSACSMQSATLLSKEGLTQDAKAQPCFTQYELFGALTKAQKMSQGAIMHKLQALCTYLTRAGAESSLAGLLARKCATSSEFVKQSKVFYDSVLMSLFAYAFKFRIELYATHNGVLSTQVFGLKDSYAIRVLITEDSYVLLKRKCKKALRIVTSPVNQTPAVIKTAVQPKSPDASFDASNSLKLNRDMSAETRSSSTTQDKSELAAADTKSAQDSFVSANDDNKCTGTLKFYNEQKEYGFIVMQDGSEIFVHKADLQKQSIDTRYLAYYKQFYDIVIAFSVQEYKGKGKTYRKAVDLSIKKMATAAK